MPGQSSTVTVARGVDRLAGPEPVSLGLRGAAHDHHGRPVRQPPRGHARGDAARRPALLLGAQPALRSVPDQHVDDRADLHRDQQRQPRVTGGKRRSLAERPGSSSRTRWPRRPSRNLAPGGGVSGALNVMFRPTTAVSYPAIVSLATSDGLCSAAPSPIQLTGTGTQGKVSVSATTLAFGTDTNDASGLVNCGATGPAHTFTVSNAGNQQFNITSADARPRRELRPTPSRGPRSRRPSRSAAAPPSPSRRAAIPSAVANPGDASPFTDTLTVTTDAALDTPHRITLVMQARGAVIANTPAQHDVELRHARERRDRHVLEHDHEHRQRDRLGRASGAHPPDDLRARRTRRSRSPPTGSPTSSGQFSPPAVEPAVDRYGHARGHAGAGALRAPPGVLEQPDRSA